jgi:hypothetical protein
VTLPVRPIAPIGDAEPGRLLLDISRVRRHIRRRSTQTSWNAVSPEFAGFVRQDGSGFCQACSICWPRTSCKLRVLSTLRWRRRGRDSYQRDGLTPPTRFPISLEAANGLSRTVPTRSISSVLPMIMRDLWGCAHRKMSMTNYRKSWKPIMTGKPIPGVAQTCLPPASRAHSQTTRSKLQPARARSLSARTRVRWRLMVLRPGLPRRRP